MADKQNTNKASRREERELERLVARTGLKGSAKQMAEQYGRGVLEGMHIAYRAVVERLLRAGNTKDEIASFFSDILKPREIEQLIREAQQTDDAGAA